MIVTDAQAALFAAAITTPQNWPREEMLRRADAFFSWLCKHAEADGDSEHHDIDGPLADIIPQPIYHGFRPEEPA